MDFKEVEKKDFEIFLVEKRRMEKIDLMKKKIEELKFEESRLEKKFDNFKEKLSQISPFKNLEIEFYSKSHYFKVVFFHNSSVNFSIKEKHSNYYDSVTYIPEKILILEIENMIFEELEKTLKKEIEKIKEVIGE